MGTTVIVCIAGETYMLIRSIQVLFVRIRSLTYFDSGGLVTILNVKLTK